MRPRRSSNRARSSAGNDSLSAATGLAAERGLRRVAHAGEEALATRVSLLARKNGSGMISVPFSTAEEFERLFELMTGKSATDALS